MTPAFDGVPDRIWKKLEPDAHGCWVWHGTRTPQGYGQISFGRKVRTTVHRHLFQVARGAIAPGLVCDHLCRNRACANPDHIEPVTTAQNLSRGEGGKVVRTFAALNAAKTHCLRGHPLAGANLRQSKSGRRQCRQCANNLNNARRREAAAISRAFPGGEGK